MNKEIFVKLLAQRQFKAVRSILDVMNEVDIASLLSDLEDKELALAFRLIPKDKAAEVFANMNNSMQTYLVEMFSENRIKDLDALTIDIDQWICWRNFQLILSIVFWTLSINLTGI